MVCRRCRRYSVLILKIYCSSVVVFGTQDLYMYLICLCIVFMGKSTDSGVPESAAFWFWFEDFIVVVYQFF